MCSQIINIDFNNLISLYLHHTATNVNLRLNKFYELYCMFQASSIVNGIIEVLDLYLKPFTL